MATLVWRRFGGQVPRVHTRLLDPIHAEKAVNAKLWSGKIRAFRRPRFEFQTVNPGPIRSIYRYRGGGKEGWLHWDKDVDVVKAPLAGDQYGRIYFTGDGRPKFADSTSVITYTVNLAEGANAGAVELTLATNRGFKAGDPCTINYGAGVEQQVSITSVTAQGGNLVIGLSEPTISLLTTANTVTNNAQRYPLVAYDLGVPAPTTKLNVQVLSGGTEGEEGVQRGAILAVEDIVLLDFTATDTATVGQVQNGSASWTLEPHWPFHDTTDLTTNGQALFIEAECRVSVRINHFNESRDVEFIVDRDPDGSNTQILSNLQTIRRPSVHDALQGSGNDWTYIVRAEGIDTPTAGTYNYRMRFGPTPGLAGDDNNNFEVRARWSFRARYSNRIRLTLNSGHGLEVGDSIRLTITATPDTPPDRDLNDKVFEVLEVDGDHVVINAPYGGVYTGGGEWQRAYQAGETEDRAYVYTYVASFNGQDFEGPPSPPSDLVTVAIGGNVRLTGFIDPTNPPIWDTNFRAIRVYRLSAGENTEAQYLFHSEHPVNVQQVDDNILGENLGEVLPTDGWELPPADLIGLIELPEGGAAGFTAKEFCMAEPYFLHAWPARNRRTTHDEIVALGAFGNSIGIATKGKPYIVTGLDPATVSMERVESDEPCQSKRGAVDLGYAFVYPSANGLMLLSVGRAEIVTEEVFTPDEWRALNPSSFVAANYSGRYLCFYDTTIPNPTPPPPDNEPAFNFPPRGGFIFDPKSPSASLVFLDLWATEVWTDPQTGQVYLVQDGTIRAFDTDRMELEYKWKSKELTLAEPVSMGWAKVDAGGYPVRLTVFGDGAPIHSQIVTSRDAFRLPSGLYDSWAVEVEGVHEVKTILLAETAEDLKRYAGGE